MVVVGLGGGGKEEEEVDRDTEGKPLERRVGKVVVCPQVHLGQSLRQITVGQITGQALRGDRSGFEMWI